MGNEVTVIHRNRSLVQTGCGGCLAIVIIILLIAGYLYFSGRTPKSEPAPDQPEAAAPPEPAAEKPEPQTDAIPKVNAIEAEAKPVKAVEDKTIVAPKADNLF